MDDENKKIVDNLTENQIEESSEKKLEKKRNKIIKYAVYAIILIFSLIFRNLSVLSTFDLGDFGSIIPLLLQTVALMGFKWLPIFSIAGFVITALEEKLGDFPNGFLIIVILITVTSSILLLFI